MNDRFRLCHIKMRRNVPRYAYHICTGVFDVSNKSNHTLNSVHMQLAIAFNYLDVYT